MTLSLLILVSPPSRAGGRTTAADLVGDWRGSRTTLDGARENVVLHLEVDDQGQAVGTLDLADQGKNGLLLEGVSVRLELVVGKLAGSDDFFEGFIEDQRTTIRGFWYYGGEDRPLELVRIGTDGEPVAAPPRRTGVAEAARPAVDASGDETSPAPAGRWRGRIQRPGEEPIEFFVDLDRDAEGVWSAELDLEFQGVVNYPLDAVGVETGEESFTTVRFVATGLRDDPVFQGRLEGEGAAIEGTFEAGQVQFPFRLDRIGSADMEPRPDLLIVPKRVATQWSGRWEGTLSSLGRPEQLVLHLEANDRGQMVGTIDLPDRGVHAMPVVEVVAWTQSLRAELPHSEALLEGGLAEDGKALLGTWSSFGVTQPVRLDKVEGASSEDAED